jgi:hypothetical protein
MTNTTLGAAMLATALLLTSTACRGPDHVTGNWKLRMGTYTWTVRLAPRPGLAGEFSGTGTRETRNDKNEVVEMGVGAALEKDTLKAWLGPGFIVCQGAFHATQTIEGECKAMNGSPAGPFKAERLGP